MNKKEEEGKKEKRTESLACSLVKNIPNDEKSLNKIISSSDTRQHIYNSDHLEF
jgi:hypothetical protein